MKDQPTPPDKETDSQVQPIIEAAEKAATEIIAEAEAKAAEYVEESRQRSEEAAGRQAQDMWALTDALIGRAEAVKRQSDELLQALNQTRRGAKAAIEAAPPAASIEPPPPPKATPPPSPTQARTTETVPRGRATPPPSAPAPPPKVQSPKPAAEPPSPKPAAPEPPPTPAPERRRPFMPHSGAGEPSEGARLLATQMAVAGSSREEITNRLRDDFGIEDAGTMLDSILGEG